MAQDERRRRLRRLYLEQTVGWAVAWTVGLGLLATVAVTTHGRLNQQDLDGELRLTATAVYGLTWFENDRFHSQALLAEPDLGLEDFDVWVLGDGQTYLAPPSPRFQIQDLKARAQAAMQATQDLPAVDGLDAHGRPFRLYALPTFDEHDRPVAAILVLADPTPWRRAQARFVRETAGAALLLALAGLVVGALLSRRAVQPVVESLDRQARFLSAAAHELRTPVAALRAVCESPDVDPRQALHRVDRLTRRTGRLVDELLLWARLDADAVEARVEPVRLDLLVESLLPEDGSIELDAESVTVEADPALLETAVSNLIVNAQTHGAPPVRVRVASVEGAAAVVVDDHGPGFSELIGHAEDAFVSRPGSPGTGLGLALVRQIAARHGGRLELEDRPDGARVRLVWGL